MTDLNKIYLVLPIILIKFIYNRAASRLRSKGNSPLGIVFTYENGMAKFLKVSFLCNLGVLIL